MRRSRHLYLSVLAAVAMVALSAPAAASATGWTFQGEPLEEAAPIEFSGDLVVYGAGQFPNLVCPVNGDGVLLPGDGGEITSFDYTSSGCAGVGTFKNCQFNGAMTTSAPWTFEASSSGELTLDNFGFEFPVSGCWPKKLSVTGEPVTISFDPAGLSGLGMSRYANWLNVDFGYGAASTQITELDLDVDPAGSYSFE